MCGIAGVLDPAAQTNAEDLAACVGRMASTLEHRGPDRGGAWSDAAAGVALAFRRLAIVDLTPTGDQPMRSPSGRWTLVFNGELYNHQSMRAELAGIGRSFRGTSDTEVLLAAIEEWGIRPTLSRTNGMFAFAAWDAGQRRLTLVRDRLGEKPLYYGWAGRTFIFGSELKALRAHPDLKTGVDRTALGHYLRRTYVPAPSTILEGVAKLAAGTLVELEAERMLPGVLPAQQAWWSVEATIASARARPGPDTEADAVDALHDLLEDSVGLRMVADVPVGAFLSGGIDSSVVVALAQQVSSSPVRTFTVRMPDVAFDESEDAAVIAAHLGTDHTVVDIPTGAALEQLPALSSVYDEPFGDPSAIPSLLVARAARREVTVALGGDGGDEMFLGYNRYVLGGATWRQVERVPRVLRRPLAWGLGAVPPGTVDRAAARLPGGGRVRNPGDKIAKLARVVATQSGDLLHEALVDEWDPATLLGRPAPAPTLPGMIGGDVVDQLVYRDLVTTLPDQMLVKVDRASMAASLEVRAPLLDHRLVELAWSVPQGWNMDGGVGKRLLRGVLDRHVPAHLLDRPKMGFDPPIGSWLRGPLRPWAEDLLTTDALTDAGLAAGPVRDRWAEHLSGRRRWDYALWTVLQYQSWRATWPT